MSSRGFGGVYRRAGEPAPEREAPATPSEDSPIADLAAGWHGPAMRIPPLLLLPLAPALSACDVRDEPRGDGPAAPRETQVVERPETIRGDVDTGQFTRLGSDEISAALLGRLVAYSPPGMADAGTHEEFHEDGRWSGIRYSRGPIPFSGRWHVEDGRLCVAAEQGYVAGQLKDGPLCRALWRDPKSGELLMEHAMYQGGGLLRLSTRAISPRGRRP